MKKISICSIALAVLLIATCASAFDSNVYINNERQYMKELLALINHYRIGNGLKPLSSDNKLGNLARGHSIDMRSHGVLSHDRFEERFRKSGRSSCVENVGWNYRTARDLFSAWQRSSGHDQNMRSATIRKAGISISGSYVTFFACN